MTAAAVALAGVASFGTAAVANTVNTIADVVFIVDESGSMGQEHAFLSNTLQRLDDDLATAGVIARRYAVIGFGGNFNNPGSPRTVSAFTDAGAATTSFQSLVLNGGTEDGYDGINYALDNLIFANNAAVNFILVTDEDRDIVNTSLDYTSILGRLTDRSILLNAIINNPFSAGDVDALGIDDKRSAYIADGTGGFDTSPGGVTGNVTGSTANVDYAALALATGGAAWNLNRLRSSADANIRDNFNASFLAIKVDEITTQPPTTNPAVVPLPAAGWMLLAGIGGLAAMRRRQKAA